MLDISMEYSRKERYTIHPTKSEITLYKVTDPHAWLLGDKDVPVCDSLVHLGVKRCANTPSPTALIEDHISSAGKTAYALMGAGLHGLNGLPIAICLKLYSTYVIPRLLYGLEAIVITQTQIQLLESFHRWMLRCIQSLPTRTSSAAVLLLLGKIPIMAKLHIKIISLMQSIAVNSCSTLAKLALRQISTKEKASKSWFIYVDKILEKYDLPSVQYILDTRPRKQPWKHYITQTIAQYWTHVLMEEATDKSTLSMLNLDSCAYSRIHPVWSCIRFTEEIPRAALKAKILCGTYILQSNKARFNQYDVSPACPLCDGPDEDRYHFLLACSSLSSIRIRFLPILREVLPEFELKHLIDCSNIKDIDTRTKFEHITRKCVCTLHEARNALLLLYTSSKKPKRRR